MTFSSQPRWSPAPQSHTSESPLFLERGWQPQPETQIEEDSPDPPVRASGDLSHLQTQRERAEQFGRHFEGISVLSLDPAPQVQTQPQQTEAQEPETTTSEPRLSGPLGSGAPPDVPNPLSGSIQPRSFPQLSPLPTQQIPAPRISPPTSVATELAQLLQAKEDSSASEPQSPPPATLQDEIGAVDTLLLQQIPLLSQRLLQASQQGIVQPSTFDTWDQLSQVLISAYPATQAAQRGEVAVPEAQQQDIADLSQEFFDSLQQEMLDSPGVGKILPIEIAGAGRILSEMATESRWSDLYRKYHSVSTGLDRWLSTQASFAGDDQAAQESQQGAEQTAGLSEMREQLVDLQEVNPTRIPVTFTMAQSETEQAELSEVPEAIPLSFYLWQAEGQWHLRQVVPGGPFTNTVPIREGQTEPPPELFAELDSKLRFPKGTLRYQIPGGEEAEVQVTGKMTPQEILGWVALALGLAALTATGVGALAGGAGLAALAGSAKGVAFTLAVGSTVAGAGSSGLSLGEQFQHGNPDGMQVTLDVVGLASSVLSLGSLVTGRIVVSQAARGTAIGNLAGRSYIPLVAGTVTADAAGLTLLVVEAPGQIQAVMEGKGTNEEKMRALAVLLSQLAVGGVLTTLSIQGDLGDIRSGGVLQIDVENGVPVARVGGEADARLETRAELTEEPDGGGSTRIEEGMGVPVGEGANATLRSGQELVDRVKARIAAESEKFNLIYTEAELDSIVREGRELGLDDMTIEDLIFTGSRKQKPLTADELISQMDNYVNVVSQRGYPYRFSNLQEYERFKQDVKEGLAEIGVPTDDIRMQGSALRNPDAKDLDIAIFVNESDFDQLLVSRFSGRARENGNPLDLTNRTNDELMTLASEIAANPSNYNAHAKTFQYAMQHRKIRTGDVEGLRGLRNSLQESYGDTDISVMTRNGGFDIQPYWVLD